MRTKAARRGNGKAGDKGMKQVEERNVRRIGERKQGRSVVGWMMEETKASWGSEERGGPRKGRETQEEWAGERG